MLRGFAKEPEFICMNAFILLLWNKADISGVWSFKRRLYAHVSKLSSNIAKYSSPVLQYFSLIQRSVFILNACLQSPHLDAFLFLIELIFFYRVSLKVTNKASEGQIFFSTIKYYWYINRYPSKPCHNKFNWSKCTSFNPLKQVS